MAARGDDLAEPHPADRVEREPRLHPHVDPTPSIDTVSRNGTVRSDDERGRPADDAGERGVVALGHDSRRGRERPNGAGQIVAVDRVFGDRLQHTQDVPRPERKIAREVADGVLIRARIGHGREQRTVRARQRGARGSVRTTSRPIARLSRTSAGAYSSTSDSHANAMSGRVTFAK